MNRKTAVVVGGGAAGFFGAIACAEAHPEWRVILIEKNRQLLSKVRVSGGGRCNVTHACFDPMELVKNYPRGSKELLGAFSRFQPRDTIKWFESRGVKLKTEADGRMFPITDSSETIIACLRQQANLFGIEVKTESDVVDCDKHDNQYTLIFKTMETLLCDCLLVATGSASKVYAWLEKLGHTIMPPVPSLFTFNIANFTLQNLAGISVPNATVMLDGFALRQTGPLLITHMGFSGPAILKLSAWAARFLNERNYHALLIINWLPDLTKESLRGILISYQKQYPTRLVAANPPLSLPKNLWKALLLFIDIPDQLRWSAVSKSMIQRLQDILQASPFQMTGKSTHKEEFVTCGGVNLSEVNFKTMESKICPKLYFAGEVLDIDGVTGGFNFQNAWTTGWLAGKAMSNRR